jgi:hypothetical protein
MPLEYHEPRDQLPAEVLDQHRAIESLIEELEAVMWYHQRAAVTPDAELKSVLLHNRDEEIEHAMMNLEWVRRNFPPFDEMMRTYLFTSAPITEIEESEADGGAETEGGRAGTSDGSLNIGPMK